VQLSNRNVIVVDLFSQVYSTQKKDDLKARLKDFETFEKETLTNSENRNKSVVDF
jgi:hypothetical protein